MNSYIELIEDSMTYRMGRRPTLLRPGEGSLIVRHRRLEVLSRIGSLALVLSMFAVGCGDRSSKAPPTPEPDPNQGLTFVQWSDPHLFDAGAAREGKGIEEEKLDNWSALHWAVLQTNRLVAADHRNIDFVVLTGDFGLYNVEMPGMTNQNGGLHNNGKCTRDPKEGPGPAIPLAEAARMVAQDLRALLVKKVFLVPGNNDLCDEDPRDRHRYVAFVLALQRAVRQQQAERKDDLKEAKKSVLDEQKQSGVKNPSSTLPVDPPAAPEIVDLTFTREDLLQRPLGDLRTGPIPNVLSEEEQARYRSQSSSARKCSDMGGDLPVVKGFCLLGLDSSYFKAHIDFTSANRKIQQAADNASISAMNRLDGEVQPGGSYLLFTHIPDIEDPHPGRKSDPGSSWLLPACVRKKWNDLLNRKELIAVFAGHFHSRERSIYPHNFAYVKSLNAAVAQKFWLAPSLAAKYQIEPLEAESARGIVLFHVTTNKTVAAKAQTAASLVTGLPIWFSPLDSNPTLALEFYRQLTLGRMYEGAGRRVEAESAYRKALDAGDSNQREVALRDLERVINTWGFNELWMQNRRSIIANTAYVLVAVCTILVIWLFWNRTRRLQIYPLDASTAAMIPAGHLERITEYLVGVMRYYSAKTGPISNTKLPYIWPGFSHDLGRVLQELIPGRSARVISWLPGLLFRPQFTLRGTLAIVSANSHIILTLRRRGGAVQSWEKSVPLNHAHDALKDMVYVMLLHIGDEER